MCMIAHRFLTPKGKGQNIPNAVIDTALARHPDGYGVAWRSPEDGTLQYEKFGPNDRPAFREFLKSIDIDQSIEYVAHFRYATHGPEDVAHAHPYAYEDPDPMVGTVLVFHNGVIGSVKTTPSESDTEVFVRDYLAKLPSRWWDNTGIRKLVNHMGGWSRLVLMTQDETVNLNWYDGHEDQGLWYSSDHKPSQYMTTTSIAQYYGKSETTGLWMNEDWEDSQYKYAKSTVSKALETTKPKANTDAFMHDGHELTPLQTFDFTKDGDYEVSVVCDTCGTAGDVYIVDGKAYIDIPHAWDVLPDGSMPESDKITTIVEADDDDDLLPEPDICDAGVLCPVNASARALVMVN